MPNKFDIIIIIIIITRLILTLMLPSFMITSTRFAAANACTFLMYYIDY